MIHQVCIRKEYKGRWEGRTPLTPDAVRELAPSMAIQVERSDTRVFRDEEYAATGAALVDHGDARIVLGIKEPPLDIIRQGQIHLCFSHTFKGQAFNMKMLRTFMDRGCTLIDYETMRDEQGVRVIAFGRYAGIAGAVDTFYVAGRKYAERQSLGPLAHVEQTWRYNSIAKLREALSHIRLGQETPIRVLIVGTGNVGRGCEEVCQWMGFPEITPEQVLQGPPPGSWYAVLQTSDTVRAKNGGPYDKQEYRQFGAERYESDFVRFLGKFDILLQTPMWTPKYPYQLPRETMLAYRDKLPLVIGDISCDIEGSLACTLRASTIDDPAYTYVPERHEVLDTISWDGPAVMAIDHLPCELAVDASTHFSKILKQYLPEVAMMDLSRPLESCGLGRLLQDATIVYRGKLTDRYAYLQDHLHLVGL